MKIFGKSTRLSPKIQKSQIETFSDPEEKNSRKFKKRTQKMKKHEMKTKQKTKNKKQKKTKGGNGTQQKTNYLVIRVEIIHIVVLMS